MQVIRKKKIYAIYIHEYVGFLPELKLRLDALLKYTVCIQKKAVNFERSHVMHY